MDELITSVSVVENIVDVKGNKDDNGNKDDKCENVKFLFTEHNDVLKEMATSMQLSLLLSVLSNEDFNKILGFKTSLFNKCSDKLKTNHSIQISSRELCENFIFCLANEILEGAEMVLYFVHKYYSGEVDRYLHVLLVYESDKKCQEQRGYLIDERDWVVTKWSFKVQESLLLKYRRTLNRVFERAKKDVIYIPNSPQNSKYDFICFEKNEAAYVLKAFVKFLSFDRSALDLLEKKNIKYSKNNCQYIRLDTTIIKRKI